MKLLVKCSFEAAHRLLQHKGKCYNLHGHRWQVEIEVLGKPDPRTGMVIDFGDIKKYIRDVFDHTCILNKMDPLVSVLLEETDVVIMDEEPTAENIALKILRDLKNLYGIEVTKVRVWENDSNMAEVENEFG